MVGIIHGSNIIIFICLVSILYLLEPLLYTLCGIQIKLKWSEIKEQKYHHYSNYTKLFIFIVLLNNMKWETQLHGIISSKNSQLIQMDSKIKYSINIIDQFIVNLINLINISVNSFHKYLWIVYIYYYRENININININKINKFK